MYQRMERTVVVSILRGDMLTKEKIQHHIKHLQEKHDELDDKIKREYTTYGDDLVVTALKKEKLELKDEIEKMRIKLNEISE